MAEVEDLMRLLGGGKGTAVVITSMICSFTSFMSISHATRLIDTANKGDYIMGHDYRTTVLEYLYCPSIAFFVAVMMEQTYILLVLGPRTILTGYIPPRRERPFFYGLLACNWLSFVGGQASLIIAMITVWHERVPKTFPYASQSTFLVLLSTLPLHMIANEIGWRLLGIAWIDGFSSIVQAENFEDCAICLETPAVGESIRSLPCKHKFHQICADEWLLRNPSCPLCRWSFSGEDMLAVPVA